MRFEAIFPLNLYHASLASFGRSPDNFFDFHGCSELVTAVNGPAIIAYLSITSAKNWKRPKCDWISLIVVGSVIVLTASALSMSGEIPSDENNHETISHKVFFTLTSETSILCLSILIPPCAAFLSTICFLLLSSCIKTMQLP